jgi:hypothetical protein
MEMTADTPQMDPGYRPGDRVKRRKRVRLRAKVDKRSRIGRRSVELKALFAATLEAQGRELTPLLKFKVDAAADAQAMAECGRQRYMRGEGIDRLEAVVTAERRADALVAALKLVDAPKTPTLAAYLAQRYGDDAEAADDPS